MKRLLLGALITFSAYSFAQSLPDKSSIINKMRLVNDYWISQNANPGNNQWARAAYFTGNMDFYKVYPKDSYLQYANLWANNNNWGLNGGTSTRNADNQICGQTYIDLYKLDALQQVYKIAAIQTSIGNMVNGTKTDDWWWVDALYMAMPVFARLGVLNNDPNYFNRMYDIYYNNKVTRGLYNTTKKLWYRDETFKPPYVTPNGKDSYWSRGNGWVLAAHVRVLQLLPLSDSHRAEYIETFQQMAQALKDCQRTDGFWNASLDDPNNYGGPETSGTGFFTYGIAWGINNQLLDSATYYPVVVKAWNALANTAIQPSGSLGYVQGVGSNPSSSQPVTVNSTADFGVGAFLLAGSEVVKLGVGTMPIPNNFTINSVKAIDKNHVKIAFSKKIDDATALTLSNYFIENSISIYSISKEPNDSAVTLSVSDLAIGAYLLKVVNIASQNGEIIEPNTTKTFTYSSAITVSASSYEPGTSNTPDKTLDFDFSTRWSANGSGQWIQYDLGETKSIESVDLAFYNGNVRKTYFSINLSEDGENFTEVFNGESNGTTAELESFSLNNQNARYVKIIGYGNSQSTWNSITETRIQIADIPSALDTPTKSYTSSIYPNPYKSGTLSITLSKVEKSGTIINIFDITGRKVTSINVRPHNNSLTLNNLSLKPGIYTLKIGADQANCSISRLIVQPTTL